MFDMVPYGDTKMINLDAMGDFTSDFGQRFLIKTNLT